MKNITRWAKNNPHIARIIITICHIAITINAVFAGMLLSVFNWGESYWLLIAFANLFFLAFIFYPSGVNKKESSDRFYKRRKAYEFSLVFFYFIVLSLGVNNFSNTDSPSISANHNGNVHAQFIVYKSVKKSERKNRKHLRSVAKGKVKSFKKYLRDKLRKWKNPKVLKFIEGLLVVLSILLTILTALLCSYFIAILGCHLSCSGYVVLPWVVMILGWAGIAWLSFISIRSITRRSRRKGSFRLPISPSKGDKSLVL